MLLSAHASEQGKVIGVGVHILYITEKRLLVKMEKGDVGMIKCFSKKYGNKGRAFN